MTMTCKIEPWDDVVQHTKEVKEIQLYLAEN